MDDNESKMNLTMRKWIGTSKGEQINQLLSVSVDEPVSSPSSISATQLSALQFGEQKAWTNPYKHAPGRVEEEQSESAQDLVVSEDQCPSQSVCPASASHSRTLM